MKKIFVFPVLAALLALPSLAGAAAKGKPLQKSQCVRISGKYNVTQLVKKLNCSKAGAELAINHPTEALPEQSVISISQNVCTLTASEEIKSLGVTIPFSGTATKADTFSLASQNLEELALPLSLGIGTETKRCVFKGRASFSGSVPGSGHLRGKTVYSLQKREGADTACPDTCSILSDSEATTR